MRAVSEMNLILRVSSEPPEAGAMAAANATLRAQLAGQQADAELRAQLAGTQLRDFSVVKKVGGKVLICNIIVPKFPLSLGAFDDHK